MNDKRQGPFEQRVELTPDERAELDRWLDAYAADGNRGRPAADVIADLCRKLRRA
jgi:hypothetical protein